MYNNVERSHVTVIILCIIDNNKNIVLTIYIHERFYAVDNLTI